MNYLAVQPSTQAFSSGSHRLARNFVTSPNGLPTMTMTSPIGMPFVDVTKFRSKSSRVSGRRTPLGASIFHINPVSQPLRASFIFLERRRTLGFLRSLFKVGAGGGYT